MEHDGNVETDTYFEDGYYHSPKMLATTLNGDKPGRVKFAYEPVTQKFVARMKSETKFTLYGDLPDILGFESGGSNSSLASAARSMYFRSTSAECIAIRGNWCLVIVSNNGNSYQ